MGAPSSRSSRYRHRWSGCRCQRRRTQVVADINVQLIGAGVDQGLKKVPPGMVLPTASATMRSFPEVPFLIVIAVPWSHRINHYITDRIQPATEHACLRSTIIWQSF
jgi:hypothetical protein